MGVYDGRQSFLKEEVRRVEVWGQEGIEQVWLLMVGEDCSAEEFF